MNVFAKFDEIPSMILTDTKETKRYGHTFGRSVGRMVGRTDNSGGINELARVFTIFLPLKSMRIFSDAHGQLTQ